MHNLEAVKRSLAAWTDDDLDALRRHRRSLGFRAFACMHEDLCVFLSGAGWNPAAGPVGLAEFLSDDVVATIPGVDLFD